MTPTAQTNATLEELAQVMVEHDQVVICGHINPDGDCLGSQLALSLALRECGKKVIGLLALNDPVGADLRFLPGVDSLIPAESYEGPVDLFVAVDASTSKRLGPASEIHNRAAFTITIDHHEMDQAMSNLTYADTEAASTSLLIWQLITHLPCVPSPEMATCAYTGLITDTGRFQYQNTNPEAFIEAASMVAAGANPAVISRETYQNRRLASLRLEERVISRIRLVSDGKVAISWLCRQDFKDCEALKADAEPLIEVLREISGVSLVCLLQGRGDDEVRGSLRAKDDTDVAAIAREYGGGGHKAAAGFTFYGSVDEAVERVSTRLDEAVASQGGLTEKIESAAHATAEQNAS